MAAAKNPMRGERHYMTTLTEDDVRLIRALAAERKRLLDEAALLSDKRIAEKFEIHPNTVWKITSYSNWRATK